MRERRRLVGLIGEARDERDLAGGIRELEPPGERERRIDAGTKQQQLDLALRHRLHELSNLGERRHAAPGGIRPEAHGLADRARRRIEQIDRGLGGGRVRARHRGAAANGQSRLGVAEHLGHLLDRLGGNAARLGGLLDVDRGHGFSEAPVDQSLIDHRLQHGQRDEPLGSRSIADPVVGIRCGHRLPRLDVNERAGPAPGEAVRSREATRVADVRQPRLDEIGAEGQHDLGVLEGVVRHDVAAEHLVIRRTDGLVAEWLEGDARARAHALHPPIEEDGLATILELSHDRDGASLPGLAQLTGLVGHELERLVPRHRLQRVAVTPLRAGETVRVIDLLQRRLAAHAERALIDRMVGIPLELHDAAVAVAREHAAAGWALTAHGREIRRDAGHDLLVRHHERQDPLGRLLAAGHGCGGARRRDDLEEVASFHLNGAPARLESWVRVIGTRGCARRKWRAKYARLRPQNAASEG